MDDPEAGVRSGAESGAGNVFEGGFPTAETIERTQGEVDLNRALQAYRFFFPSVSGLAIFNGNLAAGMVPNQVFGVFDTEPEQVGLTLNSDTPYGPLLLDLTDGPLVVELPAGPLVGALLDLHQGWICDLGLPGRDGGRGGTYLVVPPDWQGQAPDDAFVARSSTYRLTGGIRALPLDGDMKAATELVTRVTVRPLEPRPGWVGPTWLDLTGEPQDTTPGGVESTLDYWRAVHEVVDTEPHPEAWTLAYGELAALGIAKGSPFAPDERMRRILEQAAAIGNGQLRVQSFADRRPDRVVWPGRQWQWASLRYENGYFLTSDHLDLVAREKWFFQAIGASPAMFQRAAGAGSLYWLGLRDADGAYLDGGRAYTLTVPAPVPARLFWSITVYDAQTRSQVRTDQNRAALRSLFDLADASAEGSVELHFGPEPPAGAEDRWIKTTPGQGWFVYFRIYGPQEPAFDGSWQLPDFRPTR